MEAHAPTIQLACTTCSKPVVQLRPTGKPLKRCSDCIFTKPCPTCGFKVRVNQKKCRRCEGVIDTKKYKADRLLKSKERGKSIKRGPCYIVQRLKELAAFANGAGFKVAMVAIRDGRVTKVTEGVTQDDELNRHMTSIIDLLKEKQDKRKVGKVSASSSVKSSCSCQTRSVPSSTQSESPHTTAQLKPPSTSPLPDPSIHSLQSSTVSNTMETSTTPLTSWTTSPPAPTTSLGASALYTRPICSLSSPRFSEGGPVPYTTPGSLQVDPTVSTCILDQTKLPAVGTVVSAVPTFLSAPVSYGTQSPVLSSTSVASIAPIDPLDLTNVPTVGTAEAAAPMSVSAPFMHSTQPPVLSSSTMITNFQPTPSDLVPATSGICQPTCSPTSTVSQLPSNTHMGQEISSKISSSPIISVIPQPGSLHVIIRPPAFPPSNCPPPSTLVNTLPTTSIGTTVCSSLPVLSANRAPSAVHLVICPPKSASSSIPTSQFLPSQISSVSMTSGRYSPAVSTSCLPNWQANSCATPLSPTLSVSSTSTQILTSPASSITSSTRSLSASSVTLLAPTMSVPSITPLTLPVPSVSQQSLCTSSTTLVPDFVPFISSSPLPSTPLKYQPPSDLSTTLPAPAIPSKQPKPGQKSALAHSPPTATVSSNLPQPLVAETTSHPVINGPLPTSLADSGCYPNSSVLTSFGAVTSPSVYVPPIISWAMPISPIICPPLSTEYVVCPQVSAQYTMCRSLSPPLTPSVPLSASAVSTASVTSSVIPSSVASTSLPSPMTSMALPPVPPTLTRRRRGRPRKRKLTVKEENSDLTMEGIPVAILMHQKNKDGSYQYKVKWKGWPNKRHHTWEPEHHLVGNDVFLAYKAKNGI